MTKYGNSLECGCCGLGGFSQSLVGDEDFTQRRNGSRSCTLNALQTGAIWVRTGNIVKSLFKEIKK
jgi:hypothetical protein